MSTTQGISFLYNFDVGNRDINNPGVNVLRVTSTATGDFDKANVTTESVKHVWRSVDSLGLHEIVIKADIKSQIDTFAILGHNFTAGAVVKVQANIDDVWIAPPFSQQAIVDTETNNIIVANDGFGADYQYYRITVLDPSNPCGYLQVGRLIGGRAFTFINNEDINDSYGISYKDESESMATQGYYRASNENVTVRKFNASFSKIYTVTGQDTNFRNFRKMFKNVKTTRPFLTILDRGTPTTFNIWGQLTALPKESFGINQFTSFPISIEEVF